MKKVGVFVAALIVSASLMGGGVASAHSPNLEIKEAKVTRLVYLSGTNAKFLVKIKVKNLAGHKRDIRCAYRVIYVPQGAELAHGAGSNVIPAMRTRSIRTWVVTQNAGNIKDLLVEPHCHNN